MYFRGGIDYYYAKMFPKLQETAQKNIKQYDYKNENDEYFIPVGSSVLVPVYSKAANLNVTYDNNFVVACPTMYTSMNVSDTINAYSAFFAGLCCIEKYNNFVGKGGYIKTLVCPGLCTGVGRLSADDSIKQIISAYTDFCKGKHLKDKFARDPFSYIVNNY